MEEKKKPPSKEAVLESSVYKTLQAQYSVAAHEITQVGVSRGCGYHVSSGCVQWVWLPCVKWVCPVGVVTMCPVGVASECGYHYYTDVICMQLKICFDEARQMLMSAKQLHFACLDEIR